MPGTVIAKPEGAGLISSSVKDMFSTDMLSGMFFGRAGEVLFGAFLFTGDVALLALMFLVLTFWALFGEDVLFRPASLARWASNDVLEDGFGAGDDAAEDDISAPPAGNGVEAALCGVIKALLYKSIAVVIHSYLFSGLTCPVFRPNLFSWLLPKCVSKPFCPL
ncbi:hypothetical protein [Luteithermobacter gelatinilyticus]|uniref:hypothetical protein n=1 Tax=Luteithermobacter gelatinilyticus TaxID=2582913 RepID=UPI00143D5086|nr:hypothetical protein [Luteithermobacter gelatinilyticus]